MSVQTASTDKVGIDVILDLKGADRSAIAYAFLHAAFRSTEISTSPVRDALDCLTPFLVPYLQSTAGRQIDLAEMQSYLKAKFGFDIPLYALAQLLPTLANQGYAEYNKLTKTHIAKKVTPKFDVLKAEIETDFDSIVSRLSEYAKSTKVPEPPASPTWGDALLSFLKRSEKPPTKYTKLKGALIDPNQIEEAITGAFLKDLHEKYPDYFEKVVKIFMGVLIEEFISSVAEVGELKGNNRPVVYYDTAVLLRVLGCSGRLHRTATEELTRYLQDLGIQVYYLSGNETEASNIFDALVFAKDSGREIEGETAEAMSNGEITISDIRMLKNNFTQNLASKNIFPADKFEQTAQALARYQIDEAGFAGYLLQEATKAKKSYSEQNRVNDSGYLGTIMRLRAGTRTRDLAECRHLFITTNRFLAAASRRYLVSTKLLAHQHCPPMLSVGQVATIAWLMKDHALAPEKAGRELLSNCFAAVSPDAQWFKFFREGIVKAGGSPEALGMDPSKGLILQAARRIAQEESFGDTSLVRALNMAEILAQAEAEVRRLSDESRETAERDMRSAREEGQAAIEKLARETEVRIAELEEQQRRNDAAAAAQTHEAVKTAAAAAVEAARSEVRAANRVQARLFANFCVSALRIIWVVFFIGCSILVWWYQAAGTHSTLADIIAFILVVFSVGGFLDMIGVPIAKNFLERMREKLANVVAGILNRSV